MVHRPRKRFGQHFLSDAYVIDQIVTCLGPAALENIIEIGPGTGNLSAELLRTGAHLTAVEIDRDLVARLHSRFACEPRFTLLAGDALTVDFSALIDELETPIHVVGNLPYNISTPLLMRLLGLIPRVAAMTFMLQKEVVARLTATPGHRSYGRLSVLCQAQAEPRPRFEVAAASFSPPPKVDSAVVSLRAVPRTPNQAYLKVLDEIVTAAFAQRRKTLRHNLAKKVPCTLLSELGLEMTLRPEQISVNQYCCLAKQLHARGDAGV